NQMLVLAVGWQIYDITNSALSLGLVGLAHFGAQFLFTLPAGHVADRYDRRLVATLCQWIQCAVALTLAAGNYAGWINSEIIYASIVLTGMAQTFQNPAMRSLLPSLVGVELLPRCIAFHAAAKKMAIIVGPALGGLVYLWGASTVYLASAVAYALAGAIILCIHATHVRRHHEPASLQYMFGGLHYILGKPIILGAITLDLFATLLGGAVALLPIYARDILQTGPLGLGLLRSAPAVGAVVASLYLVRSPLTHSVGKILFVSVAVFGVATIVFGLSTWLPLSLLALTIMGVADMVSVVIRSSLVQLETPEEMRGRVSAVHSLFTGTANHLGQFESGITAAWWGTVVAVVAGGIGTLAVVGLWLRWFPDLLKRETITSRRE
ncbi:MAG TPA: MFS transporter, partial [Burkholderiales bacterium]|nr:MFS transporter [Burkholderiales bacterium]